MANFRSIKFLKKVLNLKFCFRKPTKSHKTLVVYTLFMQIAKKVYQGCSDLTREHFGTLNSHLNSLNLAQKSLRG